MLSESLLDSKCVPCKKGAPKVFDKEIEQYLFEIPDWKIKSDNVIKMLSREFEFSNFQDAIAFTNNIANLAEANGHHPQIITEWGRVTVAWWTHKINGLHKNDFIMAAKTDALFM